MLCRDYDDHGLSPRVRGNQQAEGAGRHRIGSIPACAGEPGYRYGERVAPPVYPRVCGGTAAWAEWRRRGQGLSPRVRGNPGKPWPLTAWLRSIPACAGEPGRRGRGPRGSAVYPRVCGGTRRPSLWHCPSGGLSPRVRGNHIPAAADRRRDRSIPACAGEPPWHTGRGSRRAVYPRVCGGTGIFRRTTASRSGLSPRVRGNRTGPIAAIVPAGSIPACAGEPVAKPRRESECRVYPRVCGGTPAPSLPNLPPNGLSPRVRGNPPPLRSRRRPAGSIPACAGEPPPGAQRAG